MLMELKRRTALLAAGAAMGLALAFGSATAQEPRSGGVLTYATGTDAQTLDPQFVTDVPTSRMVMQIYETLVYPDSEGTMQGMLAESWEVADDNRTWQFRLREGVTFHDGTPFNAEAVKFTFDRIVDPATASPRASSANSIASVEVIDEYTVQFVTHEPFAPFLAQLSAYNLAIMSPAAVEQHGSNVSRQPSGTGPFRLDSWMPGERMRLVRNEDYWGGPTHIDALDVVVVPEDSARVLMLMSGEADVVANVPPIMTDRLASAGNLQIIQTTGFRTIYVAMNWSQEPFTNPLVRRAVAAAIDTGSLVDGIMAGLATRGGGFESPVIPGASAIDPYPFEPERARELLAEAGYPNGFTTDFYVPTGRYINDRQLGEAIQAQLGDVGIEVNIQSPDWGTYQALLREGRVPMWLIGKGSPTGDLDLTLTLTVESSGEMNYGHYSNPQVDALIAAQRGIVDPAEREAVLREILLTIYEDAPFVVLFYEDQIFGARSNVHGVEVLPNEFVRFAGAWIE